MTPLESKWCSECGYRLDWLPQPRCPECGRAFDPDDPATWATRPKSGWLTVLGTAPIFLLSVVALVGLWKHCDAGHETAATVSFVGLAIMSAVLNLYVGRVATAERVPRRKAGKLRVARVLRVLALVVSLATVALEIVRPRLA